MQIVHGMSEHVGRYDDFARFLAAQGYVVCAHDHVGHGKSVSDPKEWGCLPVEGGILWCATEKVSRAVLDETAAVVKEVLSK